MLVIIQLNMQFIIQVIMQTIMHVVMQHIMQVFMQVYMQVYMPEKNWFGFSFSVYLGVWSRIAYQHINE